jgi:hypothetical protein
MKIKKPPGKFPRGFWVKNGPAFVFHLFLNGRQGCPNTDQLPEAVIGAVLVNHLEKKFHTRVGPFNPNFFEGEMDLRRVSATKRWRIQPTTRRGQIRRVVWRRTRALASATCPPAGAALYQLP